MSRYQKTDINYRHKTDNKCLKLKTVSLCKTKKSDKLVIFVINT